MYEWGRTGWAMGPASWKWKKRYKVQKIKDKISKKWKMIEKEDPGRKEWATVYPGTFKDVKACFNHIVNNKY